MSGPAAPVSVVDWSAVSGDTSGRRGDWEERAGEAGRRPRRVGFALAAVPAVGFRAAPAAGSHPESCAAVGRPRPSWLGGLRFTILLLRLGPTYGYAL